MDTGFHHKCVVDFIPTLAHVTPSIQMSILVKGDGIIWLYYNIRGTTVQIIVNVDPTVNQYRLECVESLYRQPTIRSNPIPNKSPCSQFAMDIVKHSANLLLAINHPKCNNE